MEIHEAYDLMGTYAGAASLLGCSHHTVKKHINARDAGMPVASSKKRETLTTPFEDKIFEWVKRSNGKIRADKVHEKLVAMGYGGSPRTTAYAVRRAKHVFQAGNVRVHKPWVSEPGAWLQYDFGDGPKIDGKKSVLFVAWLAWSKYRIVIPLRDKAMPSVLYALDKTFRTIGGVPTYVLSDNEKTLTVSHVAGLAVRNRQIVDFGYYYGTVFHSCVPYDPASKGGVERSVALAKDDLVPTSTNLRAEFQSFEQLETACLEFMETVNTRDHQVTKQAPINMLASEVKRLHKVPDTPFSVVSGLMRKVPVNTPMVSFENGQYSVPYEYMGSAVHVRKQSSSAGDVVVVMSVTSEGTTEIARHRQASAGNPAINDDHFPHHQPVHPERRIRPATQLEKEFLNIGDGASKWLRIAASEGVNRIGHKLEQAITLAKMYGPETVDQVLTIAATFHRFKVEDFTSIIHTLKPGNQAIHQESISVVEPDSSLAQGTTSWSGFGIEQQPAHAAHSSEVAA